MKTELYKLFTGDELGIAEKIQQRRYQMLIHSCIYYHFGRNVVSDILWDEWARELKDLQNQYPEISEKVTLYEYFKDWDGSTGYHLPITLDWVIEKASWLLNSLGGTKKVDIPIVENTIKSTKKVTKKKLF